MARHMVGDQTRYERNVPSASINFTHHVTKDLRWGIIAAHTRYNNSRLVFQVGNTNEAGMTAGVPRTWAMWRIQK